MLGGARAGLGVWRRGAAAWRRDLHALVVGERSGEGIQAGSVAAVDAATRAVGDGGEVSLLVLGGSKPESVPKGVSKVYMAGDGDGGKVVSEDVAPVVLKLQDEQKFSHIFASASTFGKNAMPRIAAKLDSAQVSDIVAVKGSNTYVRPIYAGNALATVRSKDPVQVVTVRETAFDKSMEQVAEFDAVPVGASPAQDISAWESEELSVGGSRPDLTAASVVVSGGRGLKSGENFHIIEGLADALGGAVGATRAAVDDGYCPNDMQVGQTGKVVAPELYIAVGLSGAVQHLAGMKDSKTIVAINKDKDAPIFSVADYGLVADLFEAVPQLTEEIKKAK